jgi:hypothetical protein
VDQLDDDVSQLNVWSLIMSCSAADQHGSGDQQTELSYDDNISRLPEFSGTVFIQYHSSASA